jgi:hypothetical protein
MCLLTTVVVVVCGIMFVFAEECERRDHALHCAALRGCGLVCARSTGIAISALRSSTHHRMSTGNNKFNVGIYLYMR